MKILKCTLSFSQSITNFYLHIKAGEFLFFCFAVSNTHYLQRNQAEERRDKFYLHISNKSTIGVLLMTEKKELIQQLKETIQIPIKNIGWNI